MGDEFTIGPIDDSLVGTAARLVATSDDGVSMYFRLSNGMSARATFPEPVRAGIGDVFLLKEGHLESAPKQIWPEDRAVGVILKILDDDLLVESNLSLRLVRRNSDDEVAVGNTVVFSETDGVLSVLADHPIRSRELHPADGDVESYRVKTDELVDTFADFGGYPEVVARADRLIETQMGHRKELLAIGAKPIKGVLFTGPPGTGKTHLARIIARETDAALYLVSGPEIMSKWYGGSEEALREIFDAAAACERALIFIDEIDSVAGKRGDDSHEASKRLVAQLLTLMDGFGQTASSVVVIAATNRIDDVDPALRRPGRFDWEIEFPLPSLHDRREILAVSMRRLAIDSELPIEEVAVLTDGWSAAELSSIWTEASLLAAYDSRSAISPEDFGEAFELVSARVSQRLRERPTDER